MAAKCRLNARIRARRYAVLWPNSARRHHREQGNQRHPHPRSLPLRVRRFTRVTPTL